MNSVKTGKANQDSIIDYLSLNLLEQAAHRANEFLDYYGQDKYLLLEIEAPQQPRCHIFLIKSVYEGLLVSDALTKIKQDLKLELELFENHTFAIRAKWKIEQALVRGIPKTTVTIPTLKTKLAAPTAPPTT